MTMTRISARIGAITMFAAALALAPIGTSQASAHEKTKTVRSAQISTKSRAEAGSLNLLATPVKGTRTVRAYSMGNGSYLCSPAGLGRKSRCSRN